MRPVVFAWPGNEPLAGGLAREMGADYGHLETRRFPDGESYVRLLTDVRGRSVAVVCSLDRPDEKTVALLLLASAARELGAARVGLVAPYLPYLRQDKRFHEGEAVSSRTYARLLSGAFDWLVTVEPHLHRHRTLGRLLTIPCAASTVTAPVAAWIRDHVARPALVGPDAESACRIQRLARTLDAPWRVLAKTRRGDEDVTVDPPARRFPVGWKSRTVVVVDDICSTGKTLIGAAQQVLEAGLGEPVGLVVHPLFSDAACDEMLFGGVARIVSCDTVSHWTNEIHVLPAITPPVRKFLRAPLPGGSRGRRTEPTTVAPRRVPATA
jgi:ribose-phosphate pyrophosphokinase